MAVANWNVALNQFAILFDERMPRGPNLFAHRI